MQASARKADVARLLVEVAEVAHAGHAAAHLGAQGIRQALGLVELLLQTWQSFERAMGSSDAQNLLSEQ